MDLQHLHNFPESRNTSLLRGLLRIIFCLQEVHGKDEFFQANQILVPQFGKNNRKEETPCHVITCQGRDHTVCIHSGDSILVIVDVHFEPDLTL